MKITKRLKNEFDQGKTIISYGGIKATGLGFTFLIPILLAFFLPPHELGAYSLGMMIIYFFNSILTLSSESPYVICGISELTERQKVNRALTSRIFILLTGSVIFISVVLLFNKQIVAFTHLAQSQAFLLLLVFAGKSIESFLRCIFVSLNKRIRESLFQFFTAIISLAYILVVHFSIGITLDYVFPVFFIAPVISAGFVFTRTEAQKCLPLSFNPNALLKILNYTKWVAFGGTAVYFLNWGDNIILRKFVTMEEIGIYNLGYQFFKGTIMILGIIRVYFLPFISQHIDDKKKIRHYLNVKRPKLFLLGLIFAGCLFFAIPLFIEEVYKGRYQDSILIFRILLTGGVCALFSMFYDPIFTSLKKFKITQSLMAFCVIINLALDYILVSRMGFIGAAIATAISYFILAMLKTVFFLKTCKPLIT